MKLENEDNMIRILQQAIHIAVRVLAVLMVFVIIMGVIDVGWTLYQKLISPPKFILTISDMLAAFGAFMAVLIAIEIFVNITIYLKENVIHVKIVMATALMAIARKVIVLDLEKLNAMDVAAIGFVVISMSVGYWLICKLPKSSHIE